MRGDAPPCPVCKRGRRGVKRCVEIPPPFRSKVRRNLRAVARDGLTSELRKKRKALGRKITQWRKSSGHTEATAVALPAVVARLQGENASLRARVEEFEEKVDELEEQLGVGEEEDDLIKRRASLHLHPQPSVARGTAKPTVVNSSPSSLEEEDNAPKLSTSRWV